MQKIQLLPDSVINQIAAGEVIERPASAVKELVENSLDAGATQIKIAIKKGGKELIQISDNGSGIEEGDIETSVMRHATSKLKKVDDLLKLCTNGFRGEALSSIASISKLTIETNGICAKFEAGTLKSKEEAAMPVGTTITVKDLFFNAPVRAEFLKNDSVETSRILEIITKLAMANETVRFEFKADNRILFCSPEGDLKSRISDCLGASVASSLKEVQWSEFGITVSGYICEAGKRNSIYIFLQKRPIHNAMITKAIMQAYSPYCEQTPTAIIFLDMPPAIFDINVHPAKREVRFSKDNAVFHAVNHAVHKALQKTQYPQISIVNSFKETAPGYIATDNVGARLIAPSFETRPTHVENNPTHLKEELFPNERIIPFENKPENSNNSPFSILHSIQIGNSYIVCEQGGSLLIIDQHRAHKLILYERALQALQNGEHLASQELLFPENFEIPAYLIPIIEVEKENLKKLGFYLEPFGSTTWRLRGIPAHLKIAVAAKAIITYLQSESESKESDIFKKNALSYANSSAIQTGTELSPQETNQIISDLLSLPNPYQTPKGEAVFMKMPLEDIKRKF